MKTAEDRARDVLTHLGVPWSSDLIRDVALSLKEYARDQRHLCAEAVNDVEAAGRTLDPSRLTVDALSAAHAAVMNTPFPGERLTP